MSSLLVGALILATGAAAIVATVGTVFVVGWAVEARTSRRNQALLARKGATR